MSVHRNDLRPCPCCGGEAEVVSTFGNDGSWNQRTEPGEAYVECVVTDCEMRGPIRRVNHCEGDAQGIARDQAIEAWNRRFPGPESTQAKAACWDGLLRWYPSIAEGIPEDEVIESIETQLSSLQDRLAVAEREIALRDETIDDLEEERDRYLSMLQDIGTKTHEMSPTGMAVLAHISLERWREITDLVIEEPRHG